mmetsp:Transcript_18626/g.57386  ORF Transcript_18626/g.57386 Transcript_18626/m.57386 type:complete len:232 (-) Transcript_18626:654-1349(-)
MRLPDVVWTTVGGYVPAADLARLSIVSTSHAGAVATAVAIALRRPGGTTRDLHLLERARAVSSRVATEGGQAFFVTHDGELVQLRDTPTTWSIESRWPRLGNACVVCVATGYDFGCAVTDVGTVFTWGANELGQLGRGEHREPEHTSHRREPARMDTLSDIMSVATGVDYAWAISRKGEAFSWGNCSDFPVSSDHEVFVRNTTRYVTTPVRADTHGSRLGLRGLRCEHIVM